MSTGKIELSVGAVKIANKYEIFTEEEIDAINNKIPELDERVGVIEGEIDEINSSLDNINNKIPELDERVGVIEDEIDEINSSLDNIETQKATKQEIDVERKRIDSFTKLGEGSTSGDAELLDGRIGGNGVVYSNIGNSIRNNYSETENLKNGFINNSIEIKDYFNLESGGIDITGSYYDSTNEYRASDFIPVNVGDVILLSNNKDMLRLRCYTDNKVYTNLEGGNSSNSYTITKDTTKFVKPTLSKTNYSDDIKIIKKSIFKTVNDVLDSTSNLPISNKAVYNGLLEQRLYSDNLFQKNENSITNGVIEKTITHQSNIFTIGSVDINGNEVSSNNEYRSDYIPVEKGDIVKLKGNRTMLRIRAFNEDKTLNQDFQYGISFTEFIVTSMKYIRILVSKNEYSSDIEVYVNRNIKTVDNELSTTSTRAIANNVVTNELNKSLKASISLSDYLMPKYKETSSHYELLGRWYDMDINSIKHKVTNASGSEIYFKTDGTTEINVDFTVMTDDTIPYIAYSVDGGEFIRQKVTNKKIILPNDNEHIVRIICDSIDENIGGMSPQGINNKKWYNGLGYALKDITVNSGSIKGIYPKNKIGLFYGDSITEGINCLGLESEIGSDANSSINAFPFICCERLNAISYRCGYGGSGGNRNGSFSTFKNAITNYYKDKKVDYFEPDFIVINHGTNDGDTDGTTMIPIYNECLDIIKIKYPGVPIFWVIPFSQSQRENIIEVTKNRSYCYVVETSNWKIEKTDAFHPTANGGRIAGENLAKEIENILGKTFFI